MGTYCAGVLHHCVSEPVVSLCFELQVVGAFEEHSLLQVARLLVLIAHRVLAVVGNGLGCFFGEQADERHLDRDRICRMLFVAIRELEIQIQPVNTGPNRLTPIIKNSSCTTNNTMDSFVRSFPKFLLC